MMMLAGKRGVSISVGVIVVNIHLPLSNCKFPSLPKSEETQAVRDG